MMSAPIVRRRSPQVGYATRVACALAMVAAMAMPSAGAATVADWHLVGVVDADHATFSMPGAAPRALSVGDRLGDFTLMHVEAGAQAFAVLEDFTRHEGALRIVGAAGTQQVFAKTAESSEPAPGVFLGHTAAELLANAHDVLAEQILAEPGDPDPAQIARALPPIAEFKSGTHSFLGTPDSDDKIGFAYGGRTPNFDPAILEPGVGEVRKAGKVLDGLVGGDLPVLRFVYPIDAHAWVEMLAFAPFRLVNGNTHAQPVWYRVTRIVDGRVAASRYIDSYLPFVPAQAPSRGAFYADLLALRRDWDAQLAPGMQVDIPDRQALDLARHSLMRAIMTRQGDWPKYGAYDRDYGGTEHDGFPDTFNVETSAMVEWGLFDRAGRYIDNFLGKFVRDDGGLLYRGPETGQYGRMLTVLAQFANDGGDSALLLRHRARIEAIARLLLDLRARALARAADDPAHGLIAGWSEADSSLDAEPARYVQPYFSNSTEAVRGFHDLGLVWQRLGADRHDDALAAFGRRLVDESRALRADLDTAMARSMLHVDGEAILPAIAGVSQPFHVAVAADAADPQFRSYRAYMEMMHSGVLPAATVTSIWRYRSTHFDTALGLPGAYGYRTSVVAGFLTYGVGYGLIQHDRIREALLTWYSDMAHQYIRGSWMAPETRKPYEGHEAAPYATPAQLVAPLMLRWLLVFEDPLDDTLWLGRGVPRAWLADGQHVSVRDAPTRFGKVGFAIVSHAAQRRIEATVQLPADARVTVRLRLRAPEGLQLRSASIDGKPAVIDAACECVLVAPGGAAQRHVVARYAGVVAPTPRRGAASPTP